ncbi:MAG: phosphoenolpyruvate-utilizing N-terminal domain-containing protein, partial [Acetobacteraceae bacterium]
MNRTEPPSPHRRLAAAAPSRPETSLAGIAVSPGIAIGPVFGTVEPEPEILRHRVAAADAPAEGARLEAAVAQSRKQLLKLRARVGALPEDSQTELAPLIDAYLAMLGNSRLLRGARRRIAEGLQAAEAAVLAEAEAIATAITGQAGREASAEDRAGLRRRADEIQEIARRL